jgi:hypothetical protein
VVASVSTLRRSHVRPGPSSHQQNEREELDDNDEGANPDDDEGENLMTIHWMMMEMQMIVLIVWPILKSV